MCELQPGVNFSTDVKIWNFPAASPAAERADIYLFLNYILITVVYPGGKGISLQSGKRRGPALLIYL
jgi:hypothetical protein